MSPPYVVPTSDINSHSEDMLDEYLPVFFFGFLLVAYMGAVYMFVRYAIKKQKVKNLDSLERLEEGLVAAYPDVEERKQWLLRQRFEADFQSAFPGLQAEKKRTWISEKVESLVGRPKDVKEKYHL